MSGTHVRLVLFSHAGGNHSLLTCQRATAEYFGWLKHFETYADLMHREAQAGNGRVRANRIKAVNREGGGDQLFISRSPSKQGNRPRKTHSFRVNSRVSVADLAELAHFTENEWFWMEARNGVRVDRDTWLRVYSGDAHLPRNKARAA